MGCKFSEKIIYPGSFEGNPDLYDSIYSSENGVYQPHCGLENVMLSWGHDEVCPFPALSEILCFYSQQYLYHVFKEQSTLPNEALWMIRYHSFYPLVPFLSEMISF